jgi:hypothetical protein
MKTKTIKVTVRQMQLDLAKCEQLVNQLHVELETQMGRCDHHFKEIMTEIAGLAKILKDRDAGRGGRRR